MKNYGHEFIKKFQGVQIFGYEQGVWGAIFALNQQKDIHKNQVKTYRKSGFSVISHTGYEKRSVGLRSPLQNPEAK